MFHEDNFDAEIAFRSAIERENMSHNKHIEFVPLVKKVDRMDTYKAEQIGLNFLF